MIHIEYRVLCAVSFEHGYYQNGRSADFSLVPTEASLAEMESHGLVLRTTIDRVLILQKMDNGTPEVKLDKAVLLSFVVYLNNPLLWNVSQFSWETGPGEMQSVRQFYLTNLNEEDGKLLPRLTKGPKLSEKDALPRISPQRFRVDLVKGQLGQIIIERLLPEEKWVKLPPIPVEPDQEEAEIRLDAPGIYRLPPEISGASPPVFLASDEVARSSRYFGVVDLFLDDTVIPDTRYITYIDNRKLVWRYVLVDMKSKMISRINAGDIRLSYTRNSNDTVSPQTVEFASVAPDTLGESLKKLVEQMKLSNPDSIEDVFVFGSDVPVPILEGRPPMIQLRVKDDPNFATLPVPDIETANIRGEHSLIYFNI